MSQANYGFSEEEYKIILDQIMRRAKYRKEFLKLKSDPCKNSKEAGYVFDPAMQRFLSMKASQLEFFNVNRGTILSGVCMIILPLSILGSVIWYTRQEKERQIRSGMIKYKDRLFKFQ